MKQFEQIGKPFHGVASGAAARTTMASGLSDIVRTTGIVIPSPADFPARHQMSLRFLYDKQQDLQ